MKEAFLFSPSGELTKGDLRNLLLAKSRVDLQKLFQGIGVVGLVGVGLVPMGLEGQSGDSDHTNVCSSRRILCSGKAHAADLLIVHRINR